MSTEHKKPTIRLETEQQLRIYSLPLRQRILRTMRIIGKPVTAKQIADKLSLSPSSSRHHLLKLQEIGLVEHDHYESINGIKADYLRAADVNISIGTNQQDALVGEREAATHMLLSDITTRFMHTLKSNRDQMLANPNYFFGDLISGIAHLSQEDAKEFYAVVTRFLDEHTHIQSTEQSPWECALILYKTES